MIDTRDSSLFSTRNPMEGEVRIPSGCAIAGIFHKKGGKIGGVVAPDLAKAFLGGHHRRHYRQLVIFDNIVTQLPLFQLRHPVRRANQGVERQLEKRDAAIFRALI